MKKIFKPILVLMTLMFLLTLSLTATAAFDSGINIIRKPQQQIIGTYSNLIYNILPQYNFAHIRCNVINAGLTGGMVWTKIYAKYPGVTSNDEGRWSLVHSQQATLSPGQSYMVIFYDFMCSYSQCKLEVGHFPDIVDTSIIVEGGNV